MLATSTATSPASSPPRWRTLISKTPNSTRERPALDPEAPPASESGALRRDDGGVRCWHDQPENRSLGDRLKKKERHLKLPESRIYVEIDIQVQAFYSKALETIYYISWISMSRTSTAGWSRRCMSGSGLLSSPWAST